MGRGGRRDASSMLAQDPGLISGDVPPLLFRSRRFYLNNCSRGRSTLNDFNSQDRFRSRAKSGIELEYKIIDDVREEGGKEMSTLLTTTVS